MEGHTTTEGPGAAGTAPVVSIAERRRRVAVGASFAAATFVAAGMVFLVQPMAVRWLLPLYGGAPSVWVTALVFFQAVLLAGYAAAHVSFRLLDARRQPLVQVPLLAAVLLALPVGQHLAAPPVDGTPALWLLAALTLSVGAPYFAVTTAGPVLQRWFAATDHPDARDPYFLYAASNAGSLLALLAYPLVVEPRLSLSAQADLWTAGYVTFVGLAVACLLTLRRSPRPAGAQGTAAVEARAIAPRVAWPQRLRWASLAFVPSSLLVGVTTFVATDVAAVPLLGVAPLSVYLLTFVIAFSRRSWISPRAASTGLALTAPVVAVSLFSALPVPIWAEIPVHLALLFFAGVLVHGRLAAGRPHPRRLTEFYLLLSLGGVLGGAFSALLAPVIFDSVAEYPLAVALALLLRPRGSGTGTPRTRPLRLAAAALVPVGVLLAAGLLIGLGAPARVALWIVAGSLLVAMRFTIGFAFGIGVLLALSLSSAAALHAERTFFGVLRVVEDGPGRIALAHGTTNHGVQRRGSTEPLSYFHRQSPIGDVFATLHERRGFDRVTVVGLGIGTLAAYGRPGQEFTFYEIDPAVARLAADERYFTFLRDARAHVSVVIGDGRRRLAQARDGEADLIVLDAFSSDSVPVHLLTREAIEVYLRKLSPRGLLVFNISNRHLRLQPVLAAAAAALGIAGSERLDRVTGAAAAAGKKSSHWVALARGRAGLRGLGPGWRPLPPGGGVRVWTDDYSSILGILR